MGNMKDHSSSKISYELNSWVYGLIPMVLTFVLFFQVLKFDFVWDDTIYLQSQLPAFQTFGDSFFPGERVGQFYDRYYRPLIYVSYLIDRHFWEFNPLGFHLTVLLFHLGCTLLMFFLGLALFHEGKGIPWGALSASLLFGVHPVHTESVAWMSGRSDVFAGFFMLISLCIVLNWKKGKGVWPVNFLSSLFFFLALLSKETSISMVLIYPLIPLFWENSKRKIPWKDILNISAFPVFAVLGYFLLRNAAMESVVGAHVWNDHSLSDTGVRVFLAYGFYLWKMIWPLPLSAFISQLPSSASFVFLSLVLVGVLTGLTLLGFLKRMGFLLLGGVWIWATLFPSVLIALTGVPTPLAERYLYIPSIGFSFWVGGGILLINQYLKGRSAFQGDFGRFPLFILSAFIGLWVGVFSLLTWERLPVWRNNEAFWEDTVQKNPHAWLPHQNLGLVLHNQGVYLPAEEEFQLAFSLSKNPEERSSTLTSLGITYMRQGKNQEAEKKFLESIRSGVTSPYVYYALGFLYTYQSTPGVGSFKDEQERLDRARFFYQRATELNPYYIQAFFELGQLELKRENVDGAVAAYERVLDLSSGIPSSITQKVLADLAEMYFQKGEIYFSSREFEKALQAFRRALKYQPHRKEIHYPLGTMLAALGRTDQAIQEYQMFIQNTPQHLEARFYLALLLEEMGKIEQAKQEYQTILSMGLKKGPLTQRVEERLKELSGK